MDSLNVIDRFHRQLLIILLEELNNRTSRLASGSASLIHDDSSTVAEKYSAQVSYIKALHDILAKCREIEADMYGSKPDGS